MPSRYILTISPRILKPDGRAVLSADVIIHMGEVMGAVSIIPFINIMLWEWNFSYIIIARKNKDENVNP